MKKQGVRKNQVIIAALAIMIVVAGYLNFRTGGLGVDESSILSNAPVKETLESETADVLLELTENDLQEIEVADEEDMTDLDYSETESPEDVGEAVLTSTVTAQNFSAQAKLNREQMRSKNKEALIEVINNENVTDDLKQSAMEDLMDMTNRSEMEVAAENLLTAKGFENSVVSLTKDSCDVVVCRESLTETERAQIEDIISRKTDIGMENVVITTLN
ncbi:SpoIIIAH-like family protein [Frisingicoccus sp.]|uniref:SpoIIIAH-like family protein n=1 Tax=Frisingicoccus sp. TaxID=1918627 RepID=UPI002ECEEDBB|nr:SpoIIIAH-like family protein [Frisingicoccus sp.]